MIVESAAGGTLNYSKYLFPGWRAKIDGQNEGLIPGYPFGQISLNVPPGKHIVDLNFSETPLKKTLDLISLGAVFFCLFLIFKAKAS